MGEGGGWTRLRQRRMEHARRLWRRLERLETSSLRVLKNDPDVRGVRGEEVVIDLGGIEERDVARRERLQIEPATRHQVETRVEVPLLRPADVSDGIIAGGPLVAGVVAAGTVGTRKADVQFLLVEGLPRQVHPGDSDTDQTSPISQRLGRPLHGFAGGGGAANDDGI